MQLPDNLRDLITTEIRIQIYKIIQELGANGQEFTLRDIGEKLVDQRATIQYIVNALVLRGYLQEIKHKGAGTKKSFKFIKNYFS